MVAIPPRLLTKTLSIAYLALEDCALSPIKARVADLDQMRSLSLAYRHCRLTYGLFSPIAAAHSNHADCIHNFVDAIWVTFAYYGIFNWEPSSTASDEKFKIYVPPIMQHLMDLYYRFYICVSHYYHQALNHSSIQANVFAKETWQHVLAHSRIWTINLYLITVVLFEIFPCLPRGKI